VGDCFWNFINLSDVPDTRILEYAQRYGLLRIGEHGQVNSGDSGRRLDYVVGSYEENVTVTDITGASQYRERVQRDRIEYWFFEPIKDWRAYALMFRHTLIVAANLLDGKASDLQSWKYMLEPDISVPESGYSASRHVIEHEYHTRFRHPGETHADVEINIDAQLRKLVSTGELERELFENHITRLLALADVTPSFSMIEHRGVVRAQLVLSPEVRTRPLGESGYTLHLAQPWPLQLFSLLSIQLVAILTSLGGVAICSECGAPYRAKRKPRYDQRHYCPTCQNEANLASKRRSYHTNKNNWPSVVGRKSSTMPSSAGQEPRQASSESAGT
jgi:hypothetical protein